LVLPEHTAHNTAVPEIFRLSLAEAQSIAIRKLLTKAAFDATVTPGPPLPKSHPSPALIAKLHLECAALYSSALSLAAAKGKGSSKTKGEGVEVRAELRKYLADERTFHGALARKWLGVDAGEGSSAGGEAVGLLAWARKELDELRSTGVVGKDKAKKGKVVEEIESIDEFYKHYKKVNDSVCLSLTQLPSGPC
jgi:hypothetical protein